MRQQDIEAQQCEIDLIVASIRLHESRMIAAILDADPAGIRRNLRDQPVYQLLRLALLVHQLHFEAVQWAEIRIPFLAATCQDLDDAAAGAWARQAYEQGALLGGEVVSIHRLAEELVGLVAADLTMLTKAGDLVEVLRRSVNFWEQIGADAREYCLSAPECLTAGLSETAALLREG